jgi:plastocyanin
MQGTALRSLVVGSLLLFAAGCKDDDQPTPPAPGPNTIIMNAMSFTPASITVAPGTTITWRNDDDEVHTSTSDTPGIWDTGNVSPGASRTAAFDSVGTFSYHCIYHSSMGMVGTVIVQ